MARHRIPGGAVGIRSKGVALLGARAPITDFASWAENLDPALNTLAWLFGVNRGIYTAPGRDEEWTLSVAHSEEDVRHYVAVFDELCAELSSSA